MDRLIKKENTMNFSDALERNLNTTKTTNGSLAFKSTLNANLDVFFTAGGVRGSWNPIQSQADVVTKFKQALTEDKELAIRNLINIRNFRMDGMGERKLFQRLYIALDKDTQIKMIPVVPIIGRWDDLFEIFHLTTNIDLKVKICSFIKEQLDADLKSEQPSLLAKWLPSDKGSRAKERDKVFIHSLGFKYTKEYRKILSTLRPKLNLIETKLTQKEYDKIDLEKIPSRAFGFYSKALWKYKEDEMENLNKKVESGEAQIKMVGITPDEVIHKLKENKMRNLEDTFEAQWKSFPTDDKNDNVLVMADVSPSMECAHGKPMDVSIALAIYFSERATGEFHNKFMTFSSKPSFESFTDNMSLKEKVRKAERADWGGSTNIEAALDAILETAKDNHLSQEDLPSTLLIVSDMQFDQASRANKSNLEYAQEQFEKAGYQLPNIVFWNVAGSSNAPATVDSKHVSLVSGFAPGVMKSVMAMNPDDFSPTGIMMKQLHNEGINSILELMESWSEK